MTHKTYRTYKILGALITALATLAPVNASAATIAASLKPTFQADLTNTLKLQAGSGNPAFTRATTAYQTDFEGKLNQAISGEARFQGARRIENLIPAAGSGSASLAVAANKTMTLAAGTYVFSMGAGTGTATFSGTGGASGTLAASATKRTFATKIISAGTFIVTASVATLVDLQVEAMNTVITSPGGGLSTGGNYGLVYSSVNNKIYYSYANSDLVYRLNPGTNATESSISVTGTPYGMAYDTSNNKIYIAAGSVGIKVLDPATDTITATVASTPSPFVVVYSPSNDRIYAFGGASGDTLYVINPTTNAVVTTLTGLGSSVYDAVYSPSNATVYAVMQGSNTAVAINTVNNTVSATIPIGAGPRGIGYVSSTDRIYTGNYSDGTVSVINPSTNTVETTISGFGNAWSVAYSSSNDRVYITNYQQQTFSVVNPVTKTIDNTITIPNGSYPNHVAYVASNDRIYIGQYLSSNLSVIRPERPSEYTNTTIDYGVSSGGAVLGVQYKKTFNGNTISGTSVTAGTGASINSSATLAAGGATAGVVDATGPLGYLAEGARTNMTPASNYSATYFEEVNATPTANDAVAPDGTQTATKLVETSASGVHDEQQKSGQRLTLVQGTTYTASVYVKDTAGRGYVWIAMDRGGLDYAVYFFKFADQTFTAGATGGTPPTGITTGSQALPNGWYRIWMTGTWASATVNSVALDLGLATNSSTNSYAGDISKYIHWWGYQWEAASFASSYIPTTTGALARNADVLSYPFAGNYDDTKGSYYLEAYFPNVFNGAALLGGATGAGILGYMQSSTIYRMFDNTQASAYTGNSIATGVRRVAASWGSGGMTIVEGGRTPATSAFDGGMNIGTSLVIGGMQADATAVPFGTIRNVKIWPKALTNLQLQTMTNTNTAVARAAVPQISTVRASLKPTFQADLNNTLKINAGSGNPTFTRATTAYQQDFEGKYNLVQSGEARFQGARRVQNLLIFSEDWSNAIWVATQEGGGATAAKTPNYATAPDGTLTAARWQFTAGSTNAYLAQFISTMPSTSSVRVISIWLKSNSGSSVVVGLGDGHVSYTPITVTTSWQRFSVNKTAADTQSYFTLGIGAAFAGSASSADILAWHPQEENSTGQTNTNPSEYVSTNILPAPYHGAGADGVQYFNTLNGNTVSSNVVTEKTGALITSAQSAAAGGVAAGVVDATGPLGYLAEGARTNSALGSNSFADSTYWGGSTLFSSITAATSIFPGQTAYKHTTDGSGSRSRFQTLGAFVNGQTDTFSAIVENVDATVTEIGIYDGSASDWVNLVTFTWATHTMSTRQGSGSSGARQLDATRWLIWVSGTGTTSGTGAVGHNRQPNIYPGGVDPNSKSVIIHYAGFEANASFPSSPIVTTSGALARNADVLTYPTRGNITGAAATMYGEVQFSNTSPLIFAIASNTFPLYWINSTTVRNSSSLTSLQLVYTPATIPFTTLQKVAVTYDTVANSRSLAGQGSVLASGTIPSGNYTPDATMAIGTNYSVAGNELFGTIRNVKIWPKALTNLQLANMTSTNLATARAAVPKPSTINASTNAKSTNGLVGLWSFDGKDMQWGATPIAYDRSGNGNNGTTTGMTASSATIGKIGQALKFNGVSDYVTLPSSSNFAFGTGPFTVSMWFKLSTLSTYSLLISLGGSNTSYGVIGANHSGSFLYYWANGKQISDTGTPIADKWFLVSLVGSGGADGSRTIKMYRDGVQVGNTETTNYSFPQQAFVIGGNQSALSEVMHGALDDVRIYNRALNVAEMKALYNQGK